MTKATFRYVLLIFAIIIVFNWKVLLTSQFTFLAGHEGVSSAYSWYSFWARTVKAGSLPIWDPYTWAGHPFVGEMQTGAFYPLNVLLLLAPLNRNGVFPRWVYDDSFVIAHLLGMLFMFALVREMKMSRFRSLLAAICFSLAGPMNNNMAWPDMAHSAIWLPLIFLFFLRAVRQKETKQVVVNAFAERSLLWDVDPGGATAFGNHAGHFYCDGSRVLFCTFEMADAQPLFATTSLAVGGGSGGADCGGGGLRGRGTTASFTRVQQIEPSLHRGWRVADAAEDSVRSSSRQTVPQCLGRTAVAIRIQRKDGRGGRLESLYRRTRGVVRLNWRLEDMG